MSPTVTVKASMNAILNTMNITSSDLRIVSKLTQIGGALRIVVIAQHPRGLSVSSDPLASEQDARAQALERLEQQLAGL